MRFAAFLASGSAVIGAAFFFAADPGPWRFLLVVGWQIVFMALALILLARGRP